MSQFLGDKLVAQYVQLHGYTLQNTIEFGESKCVSCGRDTPVEGHQAIRGMATLEGIYCQLDKPCKCGKNLHRLEVIVTPASHVQDTSLWA